jgi:hypothetical protein
MTTFWATMLLLTLQRQVWIRIRNFYEVLIRTGIIRKFLNLSHGPYVRIGSIRGHPPISDQQTKASLLCQRRKERETILAEWGWSRIEMSYE